MPGRGCDEPACQSVDHLKVESELPDGGNIPSSGRRQGRLDEPVHQQFLISRRTREGIVASRIQADRSAMFLQMRWSPVTTFQGPRLRGYERDPASRIGRRQCSAMDRPCRASFLRQERDGCPRKRAKCCTAANVVARVRCNSSQTTPEMSLLTVKPRSILRRDKSGAGPSEGVGYFTLAGSASVSSQDSHIDAVSPIVFGSH
jgi:hypothetical protein